MGMRLIGPVYLVGGQDFNMVYLDWPANDCNVYLVDTGDELVLIDCGCGESMSGIMANIEEMEFEPHDLSHVLLTHAHLPHSGAAEALRRNGLEVVAAGPAAEAVRAGGAGTSAYHYSRRYRRVGEVTEAAGADELTLGRCTFRAVPLPGHSAGSMGYQMLYGDKRLLFCGDAVRSPELPQIRNRLDYDHETYVETLVGLLEDPPDVLYPGHGPFCLSHAEHWIGQELSKLLEAGH